MTINILTSQRPKRERDYGGQAVFRYIKWFRSCRNCGIKFTPRSPRHWFCSEGCAEIMQNNGFFAHF